LHLPRGMSTVSPLPSLFLFVTIGMIAGLTLPIMWSRLETVPIGIFSWWVALFCLYMVLLPFFFFFSRSSHSLPFLIHLASRKFQMRNSSSKNFALILLSPFLLVSLSPPLSPLPCGTPPEKCQNGKYSREGPSWPAQISFPPSWSAGCSPQVGEGLRHMQKSPEHAAILQRLSDLSRLSSPYNPLPSSPRLQQNQTAITLANGGLSFSPCLALLRRDSSSPPRPVYLSHSFSSKTRTFGPRSNPSASARG